MSQPVGVSTFIPFIQRKTHIELKPGDFVRIQNKFYMIDQIRRYRRPFEFTQTEQRQLLQVTGSMPQRFQHLDKFSVDPEAACTGTQVTLTYGGVDVTGLQYGHVFTTLNADPAQPYELDINTFSREDIIQASVVYAAGETGTTALWFSGEEYTVVEYPQGKTPDRFVIVAYHGFSRVVTKEEFEAADMAGRLRT